MMLMTEPFPRKCNHRLQWKSRLDGRIDIFCNKCKQFTITTTYKDKQRIYSIMGKQKS